MNGKLCINFAKSDQTYPFLNLYCFHIVSAMEFVQTLNKTEDFELFIFYSHVFATFYHLCDIMILVLCHFCSSSDFIMVVYYGILSRLEWVVSSLKWRSSEA